MYGVIEISCMSCLSPRFISACQPYALPGIFSIGIPRGLADRMSDVRSILPKRQFPLPPEAETTLHSECVHIQTNWQGLPGVRVDNGVQNGQ